MLKIFFCVLKSLCGEEICLCIKEALKKHTNFLYDFFFLCVKEIFLCAKRYSQINYCSYSNSWNKIQQDFKNKLRDLSGIPIIGSFAETKGNEVLDQADQIVDLRQETQQYQDDLNVSRNRLMGNR